MSLKFNEFSQHYRERVDIALDQLLPTPEGPAANLLTAMRYSMLNGGKRIRPLLAYASAFAVGGDIQQAGLSDLDKVACALECIHAYSLIHDDLPAMDDDDLRRGKPTCHIAFGEASAILAGDALQSLAFELLSQLTQVSAQSIVLLIKHLADAAGARGMVAGQAIDLAAVNQTLSTTALEEMHNYKTGALIRASIAMGAIASGKTSDLQLQALDRYARAIGLAFQVQDDILDVVSTTDTLGKLQGADVALNKPTYVSLLGLEQAQQKAQTLHCASIDALSEFGESAEPLRALSNYIVARDH